MHGQEELSNGTTEHPPLSSSHERPSRSWFQRRRHQETDDVRVVQGTADADPAASGRKDAASAPQPRASPSQSALKIKKVRQKKRLHSRKGPKNVPSVPRKTVQELRVELNAAWELSTQGGGQGGVFLDLFAGSGGVAAAVQQLGKVSIALDIENGYDLTCDEITNEIVSFLESGRACSGND